MDWKERGLGPSWKPKNLESLSEFVKVLRPPDNDPMNRSDAFVVDINFCVFLCEDHVMAFVEWIGKDDFKIHALTTLTTNSSFGESSFAASGSA